MKPAENGARKENGEPRMEYGDRLMGANSIALRMDAAQRQSTDTRYASPERVEWVNRAWKQPQDAVRGVNPVTNKGPEPVTVATYKTTPVQNVHQKDGKGFGPQGEKAGAVEVHAGDPIYDKGGHQAPDIHEMRSTYNVYHVNDLNIAGIQPRTPPNGSARAVEAQDAAFSQQLATAGEPDRKPSADERTALVLANEVLQDQRGVKGVEVVENVERLSEARFRIKDNKPTIEIPPGAKFEDCHAQASSVIQACSHANLHADAQKRVDRAKEAGQQDQTAESRVAAYKAPLNTRDASDDYSKLELAASYATLNRVTAIPGVYVPPPSTQDSAQKEKWAKTLEAPGGMAEVHHTITAAERSFGNDRKQTQQISRAHAREERDQARAEERQSGIAGPDQPSAERTVAPGADPPPKAIQPGGDPAVGAAPPRAGSGAAAAPKTQERKAETPGGKPGEATR